MADSEERRYRSFADVVRAVRSVARHFDTDTVVVVGSQAILLANRNAPQELRYSPEIDIYPGNAAEWEAAQGSPLAEASEEINGNFGEGSQFHKAFGFYIDGVDRDTAKFPPGWEERANRTPIPDGKRIITAVSPRTEDLIVSKLCALRDKDKMFIRAADRDDELDLRVIRERLEAMPEAPEKKRAALVFLDALARER